MIVESRDNMSGKARIIVITAFAFLGIFCIGSGLIMPVVITTEPKKTAMELKVIQKRVSKNSKNEIKLKDMESEINTPLSVNVKDYQQLIK